MLFTCLAFNPVTVKRKQWRMSSFRCVLFYVHQTAETQVKVRVNLCRFSFFFFLFFGLLDRTAEDMTGNRLRERGGVTRIKGPQAGTQTQVHCSEDKASAYGTPPLPSELIGTPTFADLMETGDLMKQHEHQCTVQHSQSCRSTDCGSKLALVIFPHSEIVKKKKKRNVTWWY